MASDRIEAAREFSKRWAGPHSEDEDSQRFWVDLFQSVLHLPESLHGIVFEKRTVLKGKIDVLYPDARLLVEQKSSNVSLDKKEPRQGLMVTPVEQALRYANALPASEKPNRIITCNFGLFRVYDLDADPAAQDPVDQFRLDQLDVHLSTLEQIVSTNNSRLVVEQQLSVEAGKLVANIHQALAGEFRDPDAPESHHSLAVVIVRLVFCLYAEDSGVFPKAAFHRYLSSFKPQQTRQALLNLFEVLNTPEAERDPYLEGDLCAFPYVNGGLFGGETVELPPITEEVRFQLLDRASAGFDWSKISPVIFGSLMEETLSHDQRRQGGMHYTSVENIHRLIDPLFLDDLKSELDGILSSGTTKGATKYRNSLLDYQNKLAALHFLDPACGSGNFLTETFLQLRSLENQVLQELFAGQGVFDFGTDIGSSIKVSIDQMHGIEINGFAVSVAKTALWIAEQQADMDSKAVTQRTFETLPLHDSGHIVQENALRYDWHALLPGGDCDYVMGNPPFIGRKYRTPENVADMRSVWGTSYDVNLDYATCWHRKAAEYFKDNVNASFAFVSTNSVVQGQPVSVLFDPLFADGWRIVFGHQTFKWDAQSSDRAQVHVVIVGLDREKSKRPLRLFTYSSVTSDPIELSPTHINSYLADAPNLSIHKRTTPLSPEVCVAAFGAMANDGGNLLIKSEIEYLRGMADPIAAKYIREFPGSKEIVDGIRRWCLWLKDASPSDIRNSPFLRERVTACQQWRSAQKATGQAYQKRDSPALFGQMGENYTGTYLSAPRVVSERRRYYTPVYLEPEVLASDACITMSDPTGLAFALLSSSSFITWQLAIGGRLESRVRFSRDIVWYNFPIPRLKKADRLAIIAAGKEVLRVRSLYPDSTIADLYDPISMPADLKNAHRTLDRQVDRGIGINVQSPTDGERLAFLQRQYLRLTR